MSSPYPVLGNKPIDQWKVTELKEELKRRKLTTKGLKEDLIKRLDESLRTESESAKESASNGGDSEPQPVIQSEDGSTAPDATEDMRDNMDESDNKNKETGDIIDESGKRNELVDSDWIEVSVDDALGPLGKEQVLEEESVHGTDSTVVGAEEVLQSTSVETTVVVSESVVPEIAVSGQELADNETQNKSEDSNSQLENETQNKSEDSKSQLENEDSKPPQEEAKLDSSDFNNQVFEVSQVKSDSICTDTVSINEKNELKDNVIADDVKLELDVKPEIAQSSSDNVVVDGGELQTMDIEVLNENKVTGAETDGNNAANADMAKKNDSGDVGSAEKLNLDDCMEEDVLESKEIDLKFNSDEVGDACVKTEVLVVKEKVPAGVVADDLLSDKKNINIEKNGLVGPAVKRKLHGQETAVNNETMKRQRRWNSEGVKVGEPQSANLSPSTTPKDAFQPMAKRNFSRSDSMVSEEAPKERVVPPASKPSTNSLRIDRFLRPFTLKAVQELLGKTGTVTSFWMDHIKTHCYVTYASVEEAVETRNAVYNLQWPPNGGRLLVAEFVDPREVKTRLEAPPQSPATPASTTPTLPPPPPTKHSDPAPSPRLQVQRQQLPPPPPLPLPPPPPLSNPPPIRERLLPPPPPLPEKVDPPIVTLDDLFRKTKATPRIYYLPLSDEEVAAKTKAEGQIAKQ